MTTSGGREVAVGVPYRRPQTPDLQLKLNKKCLFLLPKAACSILPNHSRLPVCVPPRDAQTPARSPEIPPEKNLESASVEPVHPLAYPRTKTDRPGPALSARVSRLQPSPHAVASPWQHRTLYPVLPTRMYPATRPCPHSAPGIAHLATMRDKDRDDWQAIRYHVL